MMTMWAALPGPLILSADLRPGAACGGIDDAFTMETLTNPEVISVNQDPLVRPMRPVSKRDGLEVWQKPLVNGTALIMFHRNTTSATSTTATSASTSTATSTAASTANCLLTIDSSCSTALSLSFDSGLLKAANGMCVGQVDMCSCAHPPSPRLGLIACDSSDSTQRWEFQSNGEVTNGNASSSHTLNLGPVCPGDTFRGVLLYVRQNKANEFWTHDQTTGFLRSNMGGCLATSALPPDPTPPRDVLVSWAELGLPDNQAVAVRDLWSRTDLGTFNGSFTASLAFHEARMYTFHI